MSPMWVFIFRLFVVYRTDTERDPFWNVVFHCL